MLELVLANLRVRPFRTLISVIGVALGVVLVILFHGFGAWNGERYGKTCGELEGGNCFHASGRDGIDFFKRFRVNDLRRQTKRNRRRCRRPFRLFDTSRQTRKGVGEFRNSMALNGILSAR